MTLAGEAQVPIRHADRFFIGGQWVAPSSDATIDVIDSHTEEVYLTVAEAQAADIDRVLASPRRRSQQAVGGHRADVAARVRRAARYRHGSGGRRQAHL